MELLLVAIGFTLTGAYESQLEGPENTLNVVGSTVTMKCSFPSRNCSGIDWQKFIPGATPMTIFKGPRTMLNVTGFDRNRYSVNNSLGCDLIIRNVQLKDAGRFICSAIMSQSQTTKVAYLIILETQPVCTLNVSMYDTVEGDGVQLKCEATYNGTNKASMDWKGVTDAPAAVKNVNTISRQYSVVASAPGVPSYTCETSFPYETAHVGRLIEGLATNRIPNAICSTSAITVIYSVRNVTLSPSLSNYPPGTIITCAAKGHPSPTFKWQEKETDGLWRDIQNACGSILAVTDASSKRYRCVAMNVVRGRSNNAFSNEIQFSKADTTTVRTAEDLLGFNTIIGMGIAIGVGIGFIVAILLACIMYTFTMLVKHRYLELHPNPAVDGVAQHQDHEMSHSSRQHSAVDRYTSKTGAPLVGEQESTYAGLGEDRDANEYASLEQRQKAKPNKKSRP